MHAFEAQVWPPSGKKNFGKLAALLSSASGCSMGLLASSSGTHQAGSIGDTLC
jgi:hypothetical protein